MNLFRNFIELNERIFIGDQFAEGIKWRMNNMPRTSIFIAKDGDRMIAFKAGYAITINKYNSWLGGVKPEYRKQGIAKKLLIEQHDWLKAQGFSEVETHVDQQNQDMISLNQKGGMIISGMFLKNEKPFLLLTKKIEK
jgi:GNAT superfamily N-acetyltransferase